MGSLQRKKMAAHKGWHINIHPGGVGEEYYYPNVYCMYTYTPTDNMIIVCNLHISNWLFVLLAASGIMFYYRTCC